ncbi:MAG: hypothetical protein EOO29_02065, partial [Comamonadaceae bacterium]
MHEALHQACQRLAIATSYHDVWGHRIDVPPATLAALLAQFGMGAHAPNDEAAWHAEVLAFDAARSRRVLPPVTVAPAVFVQQRPAQRGRCGQRQPHGHGQLISLGRRHRDRRQHAAAASGIEGKNLGVPGGFVVGRV